MLPVLSVGPAGATIAEKRIAASADDAEETSSNGVVRLSKSDLELIHDAQDQTVGLRWTGLAIPARSTITAAYVQFAAMESQSEATSLTLSAQAADNAATFGSAKFDISSRARTAAAASWTPVGWTAGQAGVNQRTPDLSAVIQEVVNRPGWASGNALAIVVTGTGRRTAWAYDGSSSLAPLLHVEFVVENPPVASLSLAQLASPPLTVRADGSASTDTDLTPIASYRFDFGDGTVVTTTAPTATAQHTYATAGTYTVTLTVTDAGDNPSTPASKTITVNPPPDDPPVASLSVAQLASPPLTVRADGSASTDTDLTPIASYRFDFGDGTAAVTTTAPTATAQHTYATAGTYTVTLTVTDTGDNPSTPASKTITVNPPTSGGTTVERRVAAASDDAEENAAGSISGNTSDLELVDDGNLQKVGVRFTNVAIPAGSSVTSAYIQFEADETQSEPTALVIQGQAADNAGTFTTTNGNISARARTAASASWSPPPWTLVGEAGEAERTADLSAVVQEIVGRPGWASGNAIVLIITGTGHRTARSFEGRAAGAPLLHLEFGGGAPADDPPIASLSVTQLASPPLTVRADGSASTDTDLTPIASYRFDFGDGTVVTTTAPTATAQHTYATAGTYSVRLTVTDTGDNPSTPASTTITVNPPASGGTTVERRIAAGSDDAEESSTGSMYLTSSDLELVHDTSDQTVGMRWTALAIPAGSTITAAYVQFAANESQSEATSLRLSAQAADNAATFGTTSANISSRPRTAASASWAPVAWTAGNVGANQRTPDLAAVIQEVVSRPGWASGNALALIVTGTGHRTAWAYEGSSSLAPLLHVEFGGGAPGNQAPNGTIDSPTSNLTITTGQSVSFQGTGLDPDGDLPLGYFWDFGGGAGNQTVEDPGAVTFGTAGIYTVRFIVSDALGLADPTPDTRVITVSTPGNVVVDEIHWTFTGPTSVTFDWRGTENTIRYGLTTAYGQTVTALTPSPLPYSSAGPFWEARITGLQENTRYHYSIGGGADHVFKTPLPRGASGFTVYVEGDVGNKTNWPRMGVIQGMIAEGHPDFVLMVGDLTYGEPVGQAAVDRHFNDIMVWSQDVADMPAWGNHEWSGSDDLRNYKGRFDFPNPKTSPGSPAVSCCGEDWYWFDYGNVRFIAYPESWSGAWSDWNTNVRPIMDQAQSDPAIKFIVTFGHKPAYSSGYHSGSSSLKTILDALGASHSKYVLNLNGHSHNYERSYPQSGVIHVTAAPGGSNLEGASGTCLWPGGCPPPAWSAFRAMHHTAVKLRFTATGIEGTVYCGPADASRNDVSCLEGTVLDAFVIGTATEVSTPATAGTEASGRRAGETLAEPPSAPRAKALSLSPSRPNPFHTTTEFQYALPEQARVEMSLYSVQGARVKTLVDGVQEAGVQSVRLDGRALEPGVYFVRLRAVSTLDPSRQFTQTRKIHVIR